MQKDQTQRKDAGKPRFDLISPVAQEELAKVLAKGAEKYEEHGWRKGMEWSRTIGSAARHLNAIQRGEDYDPESGLPHAAHLEANAMILVEYLKLGLGKDDRYRTVPTVKAPAPVVLLDRTKPPKVDGVQKHAEERRHKRLSYAKAAYKSPVGRHRNGGHRKVFGPPERLMPVEDVLLKLVDGKTALELAKELNACYSTGQKYIKDLKAQGYKFKEEYVPRPKGVPGRGTIRYTWEG